MRITVATAGSRGDLELFVPLARGLARAGHRVRLLVNPELAQAARAQGLEADTFRLPMAPAAALADHAKGGDLRDASRLHLRLLRLRSVVRSLEGYFLSAMQDTARACASSDLVVGGPFAFGALEAGEQAGVPVVLAWGSPLSRTRAFPVFLAPPWLRLRGLPALATYRVAERIAWRLLGGVINRFRGELSLPPLTRRRYLARFDARRQPVLYAWSECLLPRPRDWPERLHVTGYWFPDAPEELRVPSEVERFLAAGPPPLYVSFGTIQAPDRRRFAALLVEALRRTGQRALVLRPWADEVPAPPECVQLMDPIPYARLLPRVRGALHHGGQGTVAAAARAGIPSVALPGVVDHYFWGRRLADAGLGPEPLPVRRLSAKRLQALIMALASGRFDARAREVGACIRAEDGVGRAVELIESYAEQRRRGAA